MKKTTISVTEFKARCLEILREVHDDQVQYTITKHNKAIAQVNPPHKEDNGENPLRDSVLYEEDIVGPVGDEWEVESKGRLSFSRDVSEWIQLTGTLPKIRWVPVDPGLAVTATRLPGDFHGDPVDRLITATALSVGAPLVSADQRIHNYRHVKSVW